MRKIAGRVLAAAVLLIGVDGAAAQDLYVYPARGQSDEQMARDKEECHDWAVKQTGVDPVQLAEAAAAPPKGEGGGGGAVGGAAMGAARGAISGDAGAGAIQGVGIGRLIHAVRARRRGAAERPGAVAAGAAGPASEVRPRVRRVPHWPRLHRPVTGGERRA